MTPLHLEMLLFAHTREESMDTRFNLDNSVPNSYLDHLIEQDLIKRNPRLPDSKYCYTTTVKGDVFVQMICNSPMPQQAWINPLTKEVIQL